MVDFIGIAVRCEEAPAPDRELDAAIAGLFSNSVESDDGDFWWGPYDETPQRVPSFTGSLDDALTLMPDGWRWVMRQACGDESKGAFFARLESGNFKSITWGKGGDYITDVISGQDTFCWAATAPLALCAASLRARNMHENKPRK